MTPDLSTPALDYTCPACQKTVGWTLAHLTFQYGREAFRVACRCGYHDYCWSDGMRLGPDLVQRLGQAWG